MLRRPKRINLLALSISSISLRILSKSLSSRSNFSFLSKNSSGWFSANEPVPNRVLAAWSWLNLSLRDGIPNSSASLSLCSLRAFALLSKSSCLFLLSSSCLSFSSSSCLIALYEIRHLSIASLIRLISVCLNLSSSGRLYNLRTSKRFWSNFSASGSSSISGRSLGGAGVSKSLSTSFSFSTSFSTSSCSFSFSSGGFSASVGSSFTSSSFSASFFSSSSSAF